MLLLPQFIIEVLDLDAYKIKIKLGEFEFEAEGSPELVREQFESFKNLIASIPPKQDPPPVRQVQQVPEVIGVTDDSGSPQYDKVFKADGRVVSLTALPPSNPDAILMIMLGQRHYRKNESVTGSEIMDGLQQSGYTIDRIDRQMDKFVTEGLVIRIGKARGTRYRLTNQGLQKAQAVAKDVIATVP